MSSLSSLPSSLISHQTPAAYSHENEKLISKLQIFRIHGYHKLRNHPILLIFAKRFPGKLVGVESAVKTLLENEIFPSLNGKKFSVLYVNSSATRAQNFPGIWTLKCLHDSIPVEIRDNMQQVYFLHPTCLSRFFLATFGRLLFSGWLCSKLRYVNRLEFLWDNVKYEGFEMPNYVSDFDEDLEYRPDVHHALHGDPTLYLSLRSITNYGFGP